MPFGMLILLPVEKMAPEDIRALRLRENANQVVFARQETAGRKTAAER